MRYIIIDDEPLAIDVLHNYCNKVAFLELQGTFTNPFDAITLLNEKKVDLIFLDIEMPQISGIDFINSLDNKPLFIFTTAYMEYAIDGFELNAVDYLIKPIPYNRFIKSVMRAKEMMILKENKEQPVIYSSGTPYQEEKPVEFVFVKSEYENIKLQVCEIEYIEGLKDYLKVHSQEMDKPVLTLMSFKSLMDKINNEKLIRVHRSFVVNIDHVKSTQRNTVIMTNEARIPIGESYKKDFMAKLGI